MAPLLFAKRDDIVDYLSQVLSKACKGDATPYTKEEGLACVAARWATDTLWENYAFHCEKSWRPTAADNQFPERNSRNPSGLLSYRPCHNDQVVARSDDQCRIKYRELEELVGHRLKNYSPEEIVSLTTSSRDKVRFAIYLEVRGGTLDVRLSAIQGHTKVPRCMNSRDMYQRITLDSVRSFGTIFHWTNRQNIR
jgi:hypothetical protein